MLARSHESNWLRHLLPPPLEPLDRLGADERAGLDDDDDGRVAPCEPVLVEGRVWVDVLEPELEPEPLLVDGFDCAGATASGLFDPEPLVPLPDE